MFETNHNLNIENNENKQNNLKDNFKIKEEFVSFLKDNPHSMEDIASVDENTELSFENISSETKNNLLDLKNDLNLNLPQIDWITSREKSSFSNDWTFKLNIVDFLENLILRGQKLSITSKDWKIINAIWWKDENWKMWYINEETWKNIWKIEQWMKIWQYDENLAQNYDNEAINWSEWFSAPIKSAPKYKSRNWITLCSKTARENLQNLWCKNVKQWNSAKDSFNRYGKTPEKFPPNDPNSSLIDLYMDASSKNRQYWHRAVWVKIEWKWFVLDPYYAKTREPMPANQYLTMMTQKYWRKIWWWFNVG